MNEPDLCPFQLVDAGVVNLDYRIAQMIKLKKKKKRNGWGGE